ncbi:Lrp/AsnC family transcriptional regulator [Altericroceibacterium spongiae]|uniref:Lrp/AsnC family transcriptional regulator n=2 Tax=Altericroceibacterium spongiae TaxID=2320269 RepID=A0A420EP55_9SPHN|nr:Lrp/AsnC family transcriptional regulator [Altericroceibacterium spongiae]
MEESFKAALDPIDYRILRELDLDGRISDVALGERVHLSSTAVARRRKILEEQGLIAGYSAGIDLLQLGLGISVLVMIELASQAEHKLVEFEEAVTRCPSMSYCSFISGDIDFLMIIHVRSFADYDRVYRQELSNLPHVAKIRSSFVMRTVSQKQSPPVAFHR